MDVQTAVGKLGKQSITRRVRRRAPGDITPEIREEVQKILGDLDIKAVQDSSKGAAAFFAWVSHYVFGQWLTNSFVAKSFLPSAAISRINFPSSKNPR